MDAEERKKIRQAVADLIHAEGCGCCSDRQGHEQAKKRLAKLLRVPLYKDRSGFNFTKFRTNK